MNICQLFPTYLRRKNMNLCAFESKYVRDVCMRPAKETEKNTLMGNRLAPISRLGDMVAMVYEDDKT